MDCLVVLGELVYLDSLALGGSQDFQELGVVQDSQEVLEGLEIQDRQDQLDYLALRDQQGTQDMLALQEILETMVLQGPKEP